MKWKDPSKLKICCKSQNFRSRFQRIWKNLFKLRLFYPNVRRNLLQISRIFTKDRSKHLCKIVKFEGSFAQIRINHHREF